MASDIKEHAMHVGRQIEDGVMHVWRQVEDGVRAVWEQRGNLPEIAGYKIPTWVWVSVPTSYLVYRYLTRNFDHFSKHGIPGPKPYPLVGTMVSDMKQGFLLNQAVLREKYGKYVGTFLGNSPMLHIYDVDVLKEILIKDFQHFTNHRPVGSIPPTLRTMLSALRDDHWRHVRNTLTPTFTGGKLRRMNAGINDCCQNFTDFLEGKCEAGETVDMRDEAGKFTMDAIARTAFGIYMNSFKEEDNQFIKMGEQILHKRRIFRILFMYFFPRLFSALRLSVFPPEVIGFFNHAMDEAMRGADKDEQKAMNFAQNMVHLNQGEPTEADMKSNPDLVKSPSGLVYSKKGLTREEIMGSAFFFFIAGFDATARGLSLLCYNLACNPDAQEKVYDELTEVMAGKDAPDYDLIKKMTYLQMCLDETLRLNPPAVATDRHCTADVKINGLVIPKNTDVVIPIHYIHHDPELWPEPEKFIPERFTAEAKAAQHPMAYLPFGQGPRNCIGNRLALIEIKLAAVHILMKFKVVTCEDTEIPLTFDKYRFMPMYGIKLKLEARSQ